MIKIEHLEKRFDNNPKPILKDVNCVINKGDVIALIGPSGTGKSTLLRSINMLDKPTSGKIFIDDQEITASDYDLINLHNKVSMVHQSYNLFEHLTVVENVMLAQVEVLKRSKQEAYDIAMKILARVGMANKSNSYPSTLSGGQKQRVAIARTLAKQPEIILFDEPTSALDPSKVDEVESVIRDVIKDGTTALIVTHDMNFAKEISNRVFYMDQGIIYEDGTPEQIFENPQKELTQRFIRGLKTLEIEINEKDFDYQGLMSSISEYGRRNQIDYSMVNSIQLVSEEILCNEQAMLLERFPNINITYEYNKKVKQTSIQIKYKGDAIDVFSSYKMDKPDLSALLIKNLSSDYEYNYDENSSTNILKVILK